MVQRAKILFPLSQIGAISPEQRTAIVRSSRIYGKYDTMVDRESAFEVLLKESEEQSAVVEQPAAVNEQRSVEKAERQTPASATKKAGVGSKVLKAVFTAVTATVSTAAGTAMSDAISGKKTKSKTSTGQKIVKNTTSAATRTLTRELTRGILGNLLK